VLPILYDIATGARPTPPKTQSNAAVALAELAPALGATSDLGRLADAVPALIASPDGHLQSAAASVAGALRATPHAGRVFAALAGAALASRERGQFNAALAGLRKLLKGADVAEAAAAPLLDALVAGSHPLCAVALRDKDTGLYAFLAAAAERLHARRPAIAAAVLAAFGDAPPRTLPAFLGALKFLIEARAVGAAAAPALAAQLHRAVAGQGEAMDEVLVGLLLMLLAQFPDALDRDRLVSQLSVYWQETGADDVSGWRAQLAAGILELCAGGAEMDEEVVLDALGDFPPNPLFGKTAAMAAAICALVNDPAGRWAAVVHAAGQCLLDALLLKNEELAEHGIEAELREGMRAALKRAFAATPGLEREIRKGLAKKKQQLAKLDALLK
jgi:hypothetical protein